MNASSRVRSAGKFLASWWSGANGDDDVIREGFATHSGRTPDLPDAGTTTTVSP